MNYNSFPFPLGQQIVELPCSKLALILIGRRSSEYAGTRFLKRGMNASGSVANDVETEQIVWDMYSTPSLITGNFTAFVQRRGSIPLFWSQDPSTRGVVGKPAVIVDIVETGTTLKENGLVILEHIVPLSARMVVNRVSMKMESERNNKIID